MSEEKPLDCGKSVPVEGEVTFKTREEYFAALQKWLQDAYIWQNLMCRLPYFMLPQPDLISGNGTSSFCPGPTLVRDPLPNLFGIPPVVNPAIPVGTPPNGAGIRYRLPPVWKRLCAEFVDSIIMFCLKLSITLIAMQKYDFSHWEDIDFGSFQQNVQLSYKIAIEMTSELLILELFYRVIVFVLEAYWLRKGENGRIGGSTPGKSLLGLRVVLCHAVQSIPGQPQDIVVVSPGTDLGWGWALARSLAKNLVIGSIYPMCFAFFFFRHNRTGYDILCHSIVVEIPNNNQ